MGPGTYLLPWGTSKALALASRQRQQVGEGTSHLLFAFSYLVEAPGPHSRFIVILPDLSEKVCSRWSIDAL